MLLNLPQFTCVLRLCSRMFLHDRQLGIKSLLQVWWHWASQRYLESRCCCDTSRGWGLVHGHGRSVGPTSTVLFHMATGCCRCTDLTGRTWTGELRTTEASSAHVVTGPAWHQYLPNLRFLSERHLSSRCSVRTA